MCSVASRDENLVGGVRGGEKARAGHSHGEPHARGTNQHTTRLLDRSEKTIRAQAADPVAAGHAATRLQ